MMTDSEIVKALDNIQNHKWIFARTDNGDFIRIGDVADLINRLQEDKNDLEKLVGLRNKRKYYRKFVDEVYRKEKGNELSDPDFDYIYELYFKLQAENERLYTDNQRFLNVMLWGNKKNVKNLLNQIKAEAYKEFAERLKTMPKHYYFHTIDWENSLVSFDRIDNLLKELVGDNGD